MKNGSTIPKISPETKEDAFALYLFNIEPVEIARRMEINFNTLRQWIMKGKWAERKSKHDALQAQLHPPEKRPIVKAFAGKDREAAKNTFKQKTGEMAAEDAAYWNDEMTPEERLENATNIAALNGVARKNLQLDEEKDERGNGMLHFLMNASQPGFVKLIDEDKVKTIEDKPHAEQTATE